MSRTRTSLARTLIAAGLVAVAAALWLAHARAWDLGGRSPLLNYDAAQYALAARELAHTGRLQTLFALPVELASHATPPWPLAVVQPGLVFTEAALFGLAPRTGPSAAPERLAALTLAAPILCYVGLGLLVFLGAGLVLARHAPALDGRARSALAAAAALVVLLDPEAQHLAANGMTEMPFTFGWLLALLMLALGVPATLPLTFGIVLGLTGLFRGNMLWLAPLAIAAAAWTAEPPRRLRVLGLAALGFTLPLLPWWLYKWQVFGSPAWDLTRWVVWDGVRGNTWLSIYHGAALPEFPRGAEAASLLAAKVADNLPPLLLRSFTGLRGLWLGALVLWLIAARPARGLAAAALVAIGAFALSLVTAAVSVPWSRYLFPARVALEPLGLLALAALVARAPDSTLPARARHIAAAGAVGLALLWGGWQTQQGNEAARIGLGERGVPSTATLRGIVDSLETRLAPGTPVMSNLGPILAWPLRRPVVHLALTPEDVAPLRRRLDTRHLLLAFRDADRAWPAWTEIVERPGGAAAHEALGAVEERRWHGEDGFTVIWLELPPLAPAMAWGAPAAPEAGPVRH